MENKMKLTGKIFTFGDNVNTDEIIPARYLNTSSAEELAKYCMEDIRPGFAQLPGIKSSILVAGENFGCGSSREHAPLAIKGAGIVCVVAQSFARIFLRNAINIGLAIVEIKDTSPLKEGSTVEVDLAAGKIVDPSCKAEYPFEPYPDFMREIMDMGGWIQYAREHQGGSASDYLKNIAQFPYKIENITF
jgi:3-isopropylmalate/(R)-2-methylmalate dehydratase small subunit